MRSGETSAKAAAVHTVCTSEILKYTHDTVSVALPQLQPWELWSPSIDQTGPIMHVSPNKPPLIRKREISRMMACQVFQYASSSSAICLTSELSESMITQRK